jgi:hypothetical protein
LAVDESSCEQANRAKRLVRVIGGQQGINDHSDLLTGERSRG